MIRAWTLRRDGAWPSWLGLNCMVMSLQMEPEVVEQHQAPRQEPELPNGMEKVQVREVERRSKLNVEELSKIEDEDVLDKMVSLPLVWVPAKR